jgi:DNA-binding Lrp family transcriptional regulator
MRVSANSVDELKETITKQIKKSDKIFSSRTMVMMNKEEDTNSGS